MVAVLEVTLESRQTWCDRPFLCHLDTDAITHQHSSQSASFNQRSNSQ